MRNSKFFVVAVISTLAFVTAFSVSPVTVAATTPTPNGFCGALNMLEDPTMISIAMQNDAPQGNTGMFTAVAASICGTGFAPGSTVTINIGSTTYATVTTDFSGNFATTVTTQLTTGTYAITATDGFGDSASAMLTVS
jgi:hypothetical protein